MCGDIIMKNEICSSLKAHFQGQIAKHTMNVKVMMNNPIAIHEHTDYITAIENELAQIAEYQDKLDALEYVTKIEPYDSYDSTLLKGFQ